MKKAPILQLKNKIKNLFSQEKVAWIEPTELEFKFTELIPLAKHLEELAGVRDRVMCEFVEYNTKVIGNFISGVNKEEEAKIPAEYKDYQDEVNAIKNDYKQQNDGSYLTFKGGVKKKVKESFVNNLLKEVKNKHLKAVEETEELKRLFQNKIASESVKLKVFVMPRMAFPQQMSANDVRRLGKLVEELKIE